MNLARALADLEGIGPAIAGMLRRADLHVVADLVRLPAGDLHAIVASQASLDDARRWQAMAWLLHVDALTPQWAEALIAAGVDGLEELLGKSLPQLQELFARARAAGLIPDEPDAATLLEIAKDAATLHWSGRVSVRVLGEDGAAVEGALVQIGRCRTTTDARGRCVVLRIPASCAHGLLIQHVAHEDWFEDGLSVSHDSLTIDVRVRRLRARSGEAEAASGRTFDEFEGDNLPALGSYRVVRVPVEPTALRDREVLRVVTIPEGEGPVTLVSIHRAWRAGALLVRHVKMPREQLPEGTLSGDLLLHLRGRLSAAGRGVAALEGHRARGKARALLARDADLSGLSRARLLQRFYQHYAAAHVLSGIARRKAPRDV